MSSSNDPGGAPVGDSYNEQYKALSGWFLGPRAENSDVFMDIFKDMFEEHIRLRNDYFPSDPMYITEEIKSSRPYQQEVKDMKSKLMNMQKEMTNSVPFFSPRYQGHMLWDVTMPSLLGFMGAMFSNQNNVDSAASPVTTNFEQQVGKQLCDMLGYNIDKNNAKEPLAWGHIACGGSIANIEALWASRNIKFVPLAVRAALNSLLNKDDAFLDKNQVARALDYSLEVYNITSKNIENTALKDCTAWQLLNLDIDFVCDFPETVIEFVFKDDKNISRDDLDKHMSDFKVVVEEEGIMSLGLFRFMEKHDLTHTPIYTAPANNHYSWPKAGTLLGIGSGALKAIQLDTQFRQDVSHLREVLQDCLDKQIPVLSVTAVMGSTEESAVDPIKEMYHLREEFKEKGLNFALLADGAWGGYFKTMLRDSPGTDMPSSKNGGDGFVPYCELSEYVTEQYNHIQLADTITIDPHKSGFCPYPGGGLCYRNGKMRYPIALFHPEVFHGEDDPTMGVYGIEGSKPGAGPAGILMSHNVIGLSNRGYGRILGQCTTTAKLFYTMWLTVARDDDPFLCVPLQEVPTGYTLESAKAMIKQKIAFKPMAEIFQDETAKDFLKKCGPDTMINTFVVNIRGEKDPKVTNKLQVALSDAMNVFVGTDASRVPLLIMQSGLDAKKHGKGLKEFKKRAGLPEDDEDLNVMANCCMNPWQWNESIFLIGDLFRLMVLNCIGRVKDGDVSHRFILSAPPNFDCNCNDKSFFLEYMTCSDRPEHRYQASIKVVADPADNAKLKEYIESCIKENKPVLFETVAPKDNKDNVPNLYNILHLKDWDDKEKSRVGWNLVNDANHAQIHLTVLDVPRYQRLDMSSSVSYPMKQKYFIYGDSDRTIMSHVISKLPDFQNTVRLSGRPHLMTERMLKQGVIAEIEGAEGSPLFKADSKEMLTPLQRSCYEISFKGEFYSTINTTINIEDTVIFDIIFPSLA